MSTTGLVRRTGAPDLYGVHLGTYGDRGEYTDDKSYQVCVERRSSSLGRADTPALNFTSARAAATSWQPATSGNARQTRLFINYFFLEKKIKHFFPLRPRPRARLLHNARVYAKNKKPPERNASESAAG